MKTIGEYMNSTFSGEFHPFKEGFSKTYIQLTVGERIGTKSGSRCTKTAKRIAAQMRLDGWKVRLSGDILTVTH